MYVTPAPLPTPTPIVVTITPAPSPTPTLAPVVTPSPTPPPTFAFSPSSISINGGGASSASSTASGYVGGVALSAQTLDNCSGIATVTLVGATLTATAAASGGTCVALVTDGLGRSVSIPIYNTTTSIGVQ